jgi:hypothetical protein
LGQYGKSIKLAFGESPLDDEILAFRVTKLLESCREQHGYAASVRRGRPHDLREDSDPVHPLRLLSPRGNRERPGEEPTSHHRDEPSALNHGLSRGEV